MLATDLKAPPLVNQPIADEAFKNEALSFLSRFTQNLTPVIALRTAHIGTHEPIYLITEFPDGRFKIYSVDIPRVNTNIIALYDSERQAIIDAIPEGEEFVQIVRGFNFTTSADESEILVCLGEEWLFAIVVDHETETYMIERNPYLDRDSDITTLIRTTGVAFRAAKEEEALSK